MTPTAKTRRLPIVFRALDIEGLTKSIGTAVCAARHDVVTVGSCAVCGEFKRIDFTDEGLPVVCCTPNIGRPRPHATTVNDVLEVPVMCAAPATTIQVVFPYLKLQHADNVIPILDSDAVPVGIVTCGELSRLVGSGVDLQSQLRSVMHFEFARVRPDADLRDAALLLRTSTLGCAVVVASQGTFLGLISKRDDWFERRI